uniref:Putative secreted protein n=1 Tax=Anopheles marajoara TaxID=58244 RepID=A0A2M4C5Y0_9DIPT
MRLYNDIVLQLLLILFERILEVGQGTFVRCFGDRLHCIDIAPGIGNGQFAANNLIYIVRLSEHDLAQQHVLERGKRLAALYRIEPLEGFIEVRESGLKVTLIGRMQDAGLQIKCCLHLRGAVDRIRCGTSGCEGRASLRQIAKGVIGFAFQQLHLHEEIFVIELLQLLQQLATER